MVPVVFALSAFAIVVNQLLADPRESLVGLSIVAAGLPAYWWMERSRRRTNTGRNTR